jgi:hypothetical protein
MISMFRCIIVASLYETVAPVRIAIADDEELVSVQRERRMRLGFGREVHGNEINSRRTHLEGPRRR